jgi:protease-4
MVFARKVWKLLVAVKDGFALLFLLLFFGLIYAALSSRPAGGRVVDGALLLTLDGSIVEEASPIDPIAMLTSAKAPLRQFQARDLERALRLAAKDERIKLVVLDMSRFAGGGQVHLQGVGRAIDEVRKSGKPVMTFANFYADDGVLLAAHASEVWVDPMGGAFAVGPGGNSIYLKGLIDRFKVTAHVFRVGTYKSAVEPYTRTDMSPEARAANEELLGALWQNWKADVVKARPKARLDQMAGNPVGWIRAAGGNIAEAGKRAGLIDRIGSKTEFDLAVAKLAGKPEVETKDSPAFAHTSLDTWLTANPIEEKGSAIGVITIAGDIVDGDGDPGSAQGERIARALDGALDDDLKALVVRVDSPGGSTMASERIRRALDRYKAKNIPIVVSMANYAASGGYWVSTPAQRIFAEPATITGSIGVFAVVPSFERLLAEYGVTADGVRTTPLSGQPDFITGLTPEVSQVLQASVEDSYARFVGFVAKSRGRTPQQIDAIAQGHVWDGVKAREVGLVDEIGDLDAALAYAAKAGKIGNGEWYARYLGQTHSAFSDLLAGFGSGGDEAAGGQDFAGLLAGRQEAQFARVLAQLKVLSGTRNVQAYCLECPVQPGVMAVKPNEGGWIAAVARLALFKAD